MNFKFNKSGGVQNKNFNQQISPFQNFQQNKLNRKNMVINEIFNENQNFFNSNCPEQQNLRNQNLPNLDSFKYKNFGQNQQPYLQSTGGNFNFGNSDPQQNQFDKLSPYDQFKALQASKANPFQLKQNQDSGIKKVDFFEALKSSFGNKENENKNQQSKQIFKTQGIISVEDVMNNKEFRSNSDSSNYEFQSEHQSKDRRQFFTNSESSNYEIISENQNFEQNQIDQQNLNFAQNKNECSKESAYLDNLSEGDIKNQTFQSSKETFNSLNLNVSEQSFNQDQKLQDQNYQDENRQFHDPLVISISNFENSNQYTPLSFTGQKRCVFDTSQLNPKLDNINLPFNQTNQKNISSLRQIQGSKQDIILNSEQKVNQSKLNFPSLHQTSNAKFDYKQQAELLISELTIKDNKIESDNNLQRQQNEKIQNNQQKQIENNVQKSEIQSNSSQFFSKVCSLNSNTSTPGFGSKQIGQDNIVHNSFASQVQKLIIQEQVNHNQDDQFKKDISTKQSQQIQKQSLKKRQPEDFQFDFLQSQHDEDALKHQQELPIYTLMAQKQSIESAAESNNQSQESSDLSLKKSNSESQNEEASQNDTKVIQFLIDELIGNSKLIEEDQMQRMKECKQKEIQIRESMQVTINTMKMQISNWNQDWQKKCILKKDEILDEVNRGQLNILSMRAIIYKD